LQPPERLGTSRLEAAANDLLHHMTLGAPTARTDGRPGIAELTAHEREVLSILCRGKNNRRATEFHLGQDRLRASL
jgi:hypothetical protein